jgi:hypothetical protein
MSLLLGEDADPVGEGQRVGEAREVEDPLEPGDAVAFQQLLVGDLTSELRDLRLAHPGASRGGRRRSVRQTVSSSLLVAGMTNEDVSKSCPRTRARGIAASPEGAGHEEVSRPCALLGKLSSALGAVPSAAASAIGRDRGARRVSSRVRPQGRS